MKTNYSDFVGVDFLSSRLVDSCTEIISTT